MTKKKPKREPLGKVVASNRKARHDYDILERLEAGMVLTGGEVKSLREGRASLAGSFAVVRDGEVFLIGMNIPRYEKAGYAPHDPIRNRKLLVHKEEIRRLSSRSSERGLTLVPLQCYFSHGLAKIELGIAKGRKLHDHREDLKAADARREVERALRRRR